MELICWKMPPTEKTGFPAASIHCSTLFHGHSNAVSQICKGQVCYQEQLATSRYSRSPSQSKPQKNPSSPTEAVHVKAEDTSGFHPNLKRYWPSAEALQDELNSGISCISYSTTVLFEEGCLPSAIQSCLICSLSATESPTEITFTEMIQS